MSFQAQAAAQARNTLLGQVLGLLAFSMIFTAGGAFVAPVLGSSALTVGGLGGLITFAVLFFWQRLQPVLRLAVFYLYSLFQGITLGAIIGSYVVAGQADVVVLAAGTTAGLVLALAGYAWTTSRDLSGWGAYLFMGLIGVLIAAVIGLFVQAPLFQLVVSAATAIVFSGYLLYHVQAIKSGRGEPIGLAISIYIDILNVFWSILRILSEITRRRG